MPNPLRRLQQFPWLALSQAAAVATVVDTLLAIGLGVPVIRQVAIVLLQPTLAAFTLIGFAFVMGAIAVYLIEHLHRQIFLNVGVLWALVLCVMLTLLLKSLFLPTLLSGELALVGIVLGVFWKGRRYWR
ncbi:peptide chain release factor 1 [Microcoleus sp. FACHB-1515]|uniref:peptide chain release factor 1 n=1 Tax=Cyanophyceae TaxID=3028117 RepID=UPI0016821FB4|nr:peptide chain release factor 1 [Microcoleus sp. FACHB-1515]MBD2089548.1 peptide chain release factor 1 [Microcoleus sp. FACHB-1515]